MGFPKSNEPTMAMVAVYALTILNQIKRGGILFSQEWAYLANAPFRYLQEFLAYVGFGFTPPVRIGRFENRKETAELNWQCEKAYSALKAMGIVSEAMSAEERRRRMVRIFMLFLFIILKVLKERQYPKTEKFQEIFEQYRQFLFHLHGATVNFHTCEMKNLIAMA